MLRKTYTIKITRNEAAGMYNAFIANHESLNTLQAALCICVLSKICEKLVQIMHNPMLGDAKRQISLNRADQLAILISYKRGYIDVNELLIQKIATDIDRTL